MANFTSLPGFRDFYPPEFSIRSHIMHAWREVARRYGFEEYDGPPLEPLELYIEKSGEEIVRQLYNFEDKGGRAVALRPEMTPTFARMVGARAGGMRKPIRWFSIPQLFRYERTQRGRLREHFQWNVDIVGESDVAADAEILAVAIDSLRMLGLTEEDIVARFNDRRFLQQLLLGSGVSEAKLPAAYAVIDKMSRESTEQSAQKFVGEVGLAAKQVDALLDLLEGRTAFTGSSMEPIAEYAEHLKHMGLGGYIQHDPRIVRGLAYYTGIVFEIFDRKGELRAICGGGRYDNLLKSLSSVDLPALGFGMGDVVLGELLNDRGLLPQYQPSLDYYIIAVSDAERGTQKQIASRLRAAGYSVAYSFKSGSVGKQFKDADARGARYTVVVGPEEVAQGAVVKREMSSGSEERVRIDDLG